MDAQKTYVLRLNRNTEEQAFSGRFLFLVAAIFVAVFVLDADFHATPGSILIGVTLVVPVRIVAISISPLAVTSAIHVAIAAWLTVAMHSPVWTHFTIIATHSVVVAATHHPVVTHHPVAAHTVAVAVAHHPLATHHTVATHLTVVAPRLVAAGSLIHLLLRFPVSLGRDSGLRNSNWSFSFLLGE
jgi:hypothetical protein